MLGVKLTVVLLVHVSAAYQYVWFLECYCKLWNALFKQEEHIICCCVLKIIMVMVPVLAVSSFDLAENWKATSDLWQQFWP